MGNTLKIVCATLLIFITGIVTGAVLVRIGQGPKNRIPRNMERPGNNIVAPSDNPQIRTNPPGGMGPNGLANQDRNFVQMLERQIRLSPEQRQQIAKIMADGQDRIRQLRQGIEPDIRREVQRTHEEIQKLLAPEQQEMFQRLMRQRLRRAEGGGPNGERRPREMREPRSEPIPQDMDQPEPPPPPPGDQ